METTAPDGRLVTVCDSCLKYAISWRDAHGSMIVQQVPLGRVLFIPEDAEDIQVKEAEKACDFCGCDLCANCAVDGDDRCDACWDETAGEEEEEDFLD